MSREEIDVFLRPWKETLTAAHETPLGRARIALGLTLAQWPFWGAMAPSHTPRPDPDNPEAVQQALLECAVDGVSTSILLQNCRTQGIPCWNDDVDYTGFYANSDRRQKQVVNALYRDAGVEPKDGVERDLARVDNAERVEADPDAVAFWRSRALTGKAAVPVIHVDTMDAGAPPALLRGYELQVRLEKRARLYRNAFIGRAGHCAVNVSETAALVGTMVQRLDTGRWADTIRPDRLNALAANLGIDEPAFIDYALPPRLSRTFFSSASPR
jgi:hypothetical protein